MQGELIYNWPRNQTYTVASKPTGIGSVFIQRLYFVKEKVSVYPAKFWMTFSLCKMLAADGLQCSGRTRPALAS